MTDTPVSLRTLPMSSDEPDFKGRTTEEVQRTFFLETLPKESEGEYWFRRKGLNADEGTVILFQFNSQIIASATLMTSKRYSPSKEGLYYGALVFDPKSIRVFDPVSENALKAIWPTDFKGFGNASYNLTPDQYPLFQKGLKNVKSPLFWLAPEESDDGEGYRPTGIDTRTRIQRQICERRGRDKFRNGLLKRYGACCVVTGSKILSILEAAHISPYLGEDDNDLDNGLLLRADVHTLFDLHLLAIEPKTFRVELHKDIEREYGHLAGVTLPDTVRPSEEALKQQYKLFIERKQKPA